MHSMEENSTDFVERMHKATGMSLIFCKAYLAIVVAQDREKLVTEFELGKRQIEMPNTEKP